MPKKFTVIIEKGEDGWFVSQVVELSGCHTQGRTIGQLIERTKEAIFLYLKENKDLNVETKFIGIQKIEV